MWGIRGHGADLLTRVRWKNGELFAQVKNLATPSNLKSKASRGEASKSIQQLKEKKPVALMDPRIRELRRAT